MQVFEEGLQGGPVTLTGGQLARERDLDVLSKGLDINNGQMNCNGSFQVSKVLCP